MMNPQSTILDKQTDSHMIMIVYALRFYFMSTSTSTSVEGIFSISVSSGSTHSGYPNQDNPVNADREAEVLSMKKPQYALNDNQQETSVSNKGKGGNMGEKGEKMIISDWMHKTIEPLVQKVANLIGCIDYDISVKCGPEPLVTVKIFPENVHDIQGGNNVILSISFVPQPWPEGEILVEEIEVNFERLKKWAFKIFTKNILVSGLIHGKGWKQYMRS